MANEDSFISEVSEEVRRDRLFALMRRYGWIAILLVVLIVGGASWNEWRKASARAAAEAKGDALITALQADNAEARALALRDVPSDTEPGARAVLALLTSAAEDEAGDAEAAAAALEQVIADSSVPQVYRDVALLKRIVTGSNELSPKERLERLQPLLAPGQPVPPSGRRAEGFCGSRDGRYGCGPDVTQRHFGGCRSHGRLAPSCAAVDCGPWRRA